MPNSTIYGWRHILRLLDGASEAKQMFFFAQMRSSQGRVIFILHIDLKIRWEEKGLRIKKITLSNGKRVKQTNPRKSVIFWQTSLEMCGKGRKRNLSPSRHPKWTFHYLITEKKDFLNNIATSFCFFFFKARVNEKAVEIFLCLKFKDINGPTIIFRIIF